MKIQFSNSLNQKPSIDFMKMAKRNFLSDSFKTTTNEPVIKFDFLNEDCRKSKHIPDYHFTNFLNKASDGNIKDHVRNIYHDLNLLQSKPITSVNLKERVKEILSSYGYSEPNEEVESNVVKVDIQDSFGSQQGIRVFLLLNM